MQASQILEIVIVTLIFSDVVPQLKLRFRVLSDTEPLCCLTSLAFTLFSFQGAKHFQPRLKPD